MISCLNINFMVNPHACLEFDHSWASFILELHKIRCSYTCVTGQVKTNPLHASKFGTLEAYKICWERHTYLYTESSKL